MGYQSEAEDEAGSARDWVKRFDGVIGGESVNLAARTKRGQTARVRHVFFVVIIIIFYRVWVRVY